MKIKFSSVEITSFKGKSIVINFPSKSSFIVSDNSGGKGAVLEGIKFLFSGKTEIEKPSIISVNDTAGTILFNMEINGDEIELIKNITRTKTGISSSIRVNHAKGQPDFLWANQLVLFPERRTSKEYMALAEKIFVEENMELKRMQERFKELECIVSESGLDKLKKLSEMKVDDSVDSIEDIDKFRDAVLKLINKELEALSPDIEKIQDLIFYRTYGPMSRILGKITENFDILSEFSIVKDKIIDLQEKLKRKTEEIFNEIKGVKIFDGIISVNGVGLTALSKKEAIEFSLKVSKKIQDIIGVDIPVFIEGDGILHWDIIPDGMTAYIFSTGDSQSLVAYEIDNPKRCKVAVEKTITPVGRREIEVSYV